MAVTNIVRRTSSQVLAMAIRVMRGSQGYQLRSSALFSTVVNRGAASRNFLCQGPVHFYSTKRSSSDESLLKVIKSEIQCAEEESDDDEVVKAPAGFPFKIEDTPGQLTITLSREYQGETITVEVDMPDLVSDDENDSDSDDETANQSLPLVVTVSKKNGPSMEFSCTAFADKLSIETLSVKDRDEIVYEGPDFSDLDENLQKGFHKYLEVRGIKPSTTNFMHEYMSNKDGREYMLWLNNVEKFIEA